MENFNCFQVYSHKKNVNIMVDQIWIEEKRIYFRVLEKLNSHYFDFRKEHGSNIYSIATDSIYSIRCRLYF